MRHDNHNHEGNQAMENSAYTKPLFVIIKSGRILTTGGDFAKSAFVNACQYAPKTWKTMASAQKTAARFEGAEVGYVTHEGFAPVAKRAPDAYAAIMILAALKKIANI